ncbi:MAG: 16S rRNA (cytosine(1402)-N(4))-methyltransferase RsmH [Oscillospiraceae bacterium]|jgi:16S rRNA (cytosine1402-N4)-methyltransferase|nr:16S rRNA (cytosine(1402)-N(4))-methyltransferase RsmH [Oscillospiraceae bacterium]
MKAEHTSVLLQESIDLLDIQPGKLYADATMGLGGHSAEILARGGRLIGIDQDGQAVAHCRAKFADNPNVTIIHDNFFKIKSLLEKCGISQLDGILADLGFSSMQMSDEQRGFSYQVDSPLDMRMSAQGATAADAVNTLSEQALADILWRYADEKFSRPIARAIVRARAEKPITTTFQLADLVRAAVPAAARRDGHPARGTFQALRIHVNGELDGLPQALDDLFDCLAPGGRLAVISFHSAEDRLVKQAFAKHLQGCVCPPGCPQCLCGRTPDGRRLGRPKTPSAEEIAANPRARSAKLRGIQRISLT